jgi:ribosomal protein S12 methylthiotransferase
LFAYSEEAGTYAADLDGKVAAEIIEARLAEARAVQDDITTVKRSASVGDVVEVLVDREGVARSHREAPEIDGVISVPSSLPVGTFQKVRISASAGYDLVGEPA